MDNRLIFLYHSVHVMNDGVTREDMSAGDWLCRYKLEGGDPRQIQDLVNAEE